MKEMKEKTFIGAPTPRAFAAVGGRGRRKILYPINF